MAGPQLWTSWAAYPHVVSDLELINDAIDDLYDLTTALRPLDYGAVGNGSTDDTTAWANCVAALNAAGGGTIDGVGKTYLVSTVVFDSNTTVINTWFKTKPGSTDFVSPVTVGAYSDTRTRQHVTFRNVHVDGQRSAQTTIGATEDGGRHGFRLVGPLFDILLEDCTADYCASDGISYFHGAGMSGILSATTGIASKVRLNRCSFTFNRRHGGSADSMVDFIATDCKFNDNGLDTAGGAATDHGNHGATYGGNRYGNGFDVEEYAVNTYAGDFQFLNCEGLRNARQGLLFYQGDNLADDPAWVTRKRFTIRGGHYDTGIDSTATIYALTVTPKGVNSALGNYYEDVAIENVRLDGVPELRSILNARHIGGTTADTTYGGLADRVVNLRVSSVDSGGKLYYNSNSSVVYTDRPPQIDVFAASGTWTKPDGAQLVHVVVVSGGSGGGSGRRGAAGSVRCGGGAGGGGGVSSRTISASVCGATETVTVGAGGAGGAAVTADSTDGSAGGSGAVSKFGNHVKAWNSNGGAGGTNAAGAGGGGGVASGIGGTGGSASGSGGVGGAGTSGSTGGASGGGAGGGITSGDSPSAGGAGGNSGSTERTASSGAAINTAATPATNSPAGSAEPGVGGGGGGASIVGAAGAGAAGSLYGGGGGGGGASLNGNNSGAGGAGGAGYVLAITTF